MVVVATVVDDSASDVRAVVPVAIEVVVVASGLVVVSDKAKVLDSKAVAVAVP